MPNTRMIEDRQNGKRKCQLEVYQVWYLLYTRRPEKTATIVFGHK